MTKHSNQSLSPIAFYGIGLAPIVLLCSTILDALKFSAVLLVCMALCNLLYFAFKPIVKDSVRIPCYVLLIIGIEYLIDSVLSEFVVKDTTAIVSFVSYLFSATVIIYMFETSSKVKKFNESMLDCVMMAGEYAMCLLVVGLVREFLGFGTLFGARIFKSGIPFFVSNAGGVFVTLMYVFVYSILTANIGKKRVAYNGLVDRYELFLEDKFMELTPMKSLDEMVSENEQNIGEVGDTAQTSANEEVR